MNNPREKKSGFVSFSKASKVDTKVEASGKHPTQSPAFAPEIDKDSQLENFPTEETKFRIKPHKLQAELVKDEAIEKYVDRNSMLAVYHDMRKNNPSLLDLMAMGQNEMEDPLPTG